MINSNIDKIGEIRGISFVYTLKPTLNLLGLKPSSNERVSIIVKKGIESINLSLSDLERINSLDIIPPEYQENASNLLIKFSALLNRCFVIDDKNFYGNENIGSFKLPFISGYRSVNSNNNVGGAQKSKHLTGEALDFNLQYAIDAKVDVIKISYLILKDVYKIDENILKSLFDITKNNNNNAQEPNIFTFKGLAYTRQVLQVNSEDVTSLPKTFFVYEQQNFIHVDIRQEEEGRIIFQAKERPITNNTKKQTQNNEDDND